MNRDRALGSGYQVSNVLLKMSEAPRDYYAIGITHSMDTFRVLQEILDQRRFGLTTEGTSVSGYELYVYGDAVEDAVSKIRVSQHVQLRDHSVSLYDRPRSIKDGARYDRLIDHTEGPDPNRPSANGISFKL